MARIRSIKPEFWLDRKLARRLSRDERMLYMGLWNQCDAHGRALGDPVVIKGQVFPYDDDLTVDVIDRMLNRLDTAGEVVQRYEVDGDPYLFLPKLGNHQRLEPGKSKSRHPAPPPRLLATVVTQQSEQTAESATDFSGGPSSALHENDNETATFGHDQEVQPDRGTATVFSDESAQDPGNKSLLYGTGSMEQGGVSQTRPRKAEDPPQPFCPKHPGGTPEKCGLCAGARKRWLADKLERDEAAEREAAEIAEVERQQKHQAAQDRARAVDNCPLGCGIGDTPGYIDGALCDHDPETADRRARGMAQVRAKLAAAKAAKESRADQSPPEPVSPAHVPASPPQSLSEINSDTPEESNA